jgi:trans-feruloyl-CoA hydratase/vanillin synthase
MLLPRHALYYAVTGEPFDGKRAAEIGLINFAVPKEKLREETLKLANKLLKLNANVVRFTKEGIKAVREMNANQARDYLRSKQDSLVRNDKEIREQVGMKQFLDEKSYRPGLGPFKRAES